MIHWLYGVNNLCRKRGQLESDAHCASATGVGWAAAQRSFSGRHYFALFLVIRDALISTVQRIAAGTSVSSSGTVDGVVYGIGAEAFILPPVSIRLEALRYDYGTEKLSVASGITALSGIDRGDTLVRAGVTLHFK